MIARYIMITAVLIMCCTAAGADECNSLRYVDNADGTVTDCRTGLIWLKDANCLDTSNGIVKLSGMLNWYDAMKWAAGLGNGLCGLTDGSAAGDWRLPTDTEWMAAMESGRKHGLTPVITDAVGTAAWTANGNAFSNVMSFAFGPYWASIRYPAAHAWRVILYANGALEHVDTTIHPAFVWPIRGGQTGTFGSLRIE